MGAAAEDEGHHEESHARERPGEHLGLDPAARLQSIPAVAMLLDRSLEARAHPHEIEIRHGVGEHRERGGSEREEKVPAEGASSVGDVDTVEYRDADGGDGEKMKSQEAERHAASL